MIQREVQDSNNTKWQCVQAFSGVHTSAATEAAEVAVDGNGMVDVVCTPSGGAQTVRLKLSKDWPEKMDDESLINAIESAS